MTLSPLFSDGCVLRHGAGTRIWGVAAPNARVDIKFQARAYTVTSDSAGAFEIMLEALAPGGPFELNVCCDSDEITLRDVYVGEIWLCSGQSNMEITLARIGRRYPEVMAAACEPRLRHFAVPTAYDLKAPQQNLPGGKWLESSPGTISEFSAVGYFFARKRLERTGVPIGLIKAAVGGTPIACWMRDDYIPADSAPPLATGIPQSGEPCDPTVTQSDGGVIWWLKRVIIPPEFADKPSELALGTIVDADITYVNGVEVGRTDYRYPPRYYNVPPLPEGECVIAVKQLIAGAWGKFTESKTRELRFPNGSIPLEGDWERRRASWSAQERGVEGADSSCGFYNAMTAPLTKFAIDGALWYQGESDCAAPQHYFEKFCHMLHGWRDAWGYDFPILTVGLARYDERDFTALREEQLKCAALPGVEYFDAWDYGEPNDVHPLEKQPIGEGLADILERLEY